MLAIGDSFVPKAVFMAALSPFVAPHQVRFITLDEMVPFTPSTPSECAIREYAGAPGWVAHALRDEEILFVHGAPVTDTVLDASPHLRVVCVARGGPVNVDVAAATARGIAVVTAPGRNAEAVADLTLAFIIMLARGVPASMAFVADGGRLGDSAFEGARFFGHELGGHVLGLVGYGQVGERVARRALGFGMTILVHDPYVEPARIERPGVRAAALDDLLFQSDFVSVHARATTENADLFDERAFSRMKRGAFFINTARETLVDEAALHRALMTRHIAGAALDVLKLRTDDGPHPLLSAGNVIVTPHIGGATYEAARRGVEILANQIERYVAGAEMEHTVNESVAGGRAR